MELYQGQGSEPSRLVVGHNGEDLSYVELNNTGDQPFNSKWKAGVNPESLGPVIKGLGELIPHPVRLANSFESYGVGLNPSAYTKQQMPHSAG